MKYNTVSLCLVAVFCSFSMQCEEAPPQLDKLIEQLDADEFDTRTRAIADIRKIGVPALDALKKQVANAGSLEVKALCDEIAELRPEGSGEPVNGLRIKLSANRKNLVNGEKVQFTISLYNTTDYEMKVVCGHPHNFFENGEIFHYVYINGYQRLESKSGYIGPTNNQYEPKFVEIKGHSRCQFKAAAKVTFDARSHYYYLYFEHFSLAPILEGSSARFHLELSTPDATKRDPGNAAIGLWFGNIKSNEIELVPGK